MRILAISDTESPYLYDYFDKKNFADVELVLAAGDLKAYYLSFLATMLPVPILYVHGNHDVALLEHPAEGCICIDDAVYTYKGLRIAGLGGCMCYSGGPLQYTEKEMQWRIRKHWWRYRKGIDILLTHAPAHGIGDGDDLPHTGFQCFLKLMDRYQPRLFVHGHQHLNYSRNNRTHQYGSTKIVNADGYTFLDL